MGNTTIAASSIVDSDRLSASAEIVDRPGQSNGPPEIFWRSLHYFNLYRLGVATFFLSAIQIYGDTLGFGAQNPDLFAWVSTAYLLLGALFYLAPQLFRGSFSFHLTLQVVVDILLLTVLMYASGGAKSGMAIMLLVVLAAAGLVGQGRLSLFFAALATLALLLEQAYRVLEFGANLEDFMRSGITSIGFFAIAISARLLARRVVANEELARRRGVELANQMLINQRVIRDMQDGVLVVAADGMVKQHNPQAENLLGMRAEPLTDLAAVSPTLAQCFMRWRQQSVETAETMRIPDNGRLLRVRFLPAGEGGNALLYIEDMERELAQVQQLKLAALGRLTANMAHEIRNPLSAISHAAELLAEEPGDETLQRLTRIIGDNTQRLNRLVGEVLELGRRDSAHAELLGVKGFIEAFLDDYAVNEPQIKEIVVLSLDPSAMLSFDRSHLNRVLWNLLGNALRHCRRQPGSIRLESQASAYPGHTELHIIDDGAGIATALQSQVFEPFFTTHSSGTGLGLYIARELCEANGALLEIQANAPGAHFCLTGKGD
ncbi:MAG: PAS domain-containing protein [Betaproteobacteria bacterium]|nr:PAS domain-containing protein [Betaproteobacteria bacterium]